MQLFTIGYEGTGFSAFLATLQQAGVKTVIDVRDLPLSRRAGFSKRVLAASLAEHGIGYLHLKPLGTPKEGRIANKRRQWDLFWQIVDRQLATPEAGFALAHAATVASEAPSCLMCFEADHQTCHRRRVAEALEAQGFKVTHLHVDPGPP